MQLDLTTTNGAGLLSIPGITLEDPDKLRRFASFVNAPATPDPSLAYTAERGQPRPATIAQLVGILARAA